MDESTFVSWLLEADTPSLRYLTLHQLLGLSADHPQVVAARDAIATAGPVPVILAAQTDAGHWPDEHSYYTPKYRATHWSMTLLTELHADPAEARFQRGVEYMLTTLDAELRAWLADEKRGWSCFWGNLLRYAAYSGQADDDRVGRLVRFALQDIQDGHCRCEYNEGFACAWGVVRTLYGLAAIPQSMRDDTFTATVDQALAFLLESFNLIEADYPTPTDGKIHPMWFRLNFPLFYQVDILFTLRVLAEFDALDHPGVTAALDWIEGKRAKNGRWRGSSPYGRLTWRELGGSAETARWVSLHTALILKQAGRFSVDSADVNIA